jgi:hypothetical protein
MPLLILDVSDFCPLGQWVRNTGSNRGEKLQHFLVLLRLAMGSGFSDSLDVPLDLTEPPTGPNK